MANSIAGFLPNKKTKKQKGKGDEVIIISGSYGSGKTTMLKELSETINCKFKYINMDRNVEINPLDILNVKSKFPFTNRVDNTFTKSIQFFVHRFFRWLFLFVSNKLTFVSVIGAITTLIAIDNMKLEMYLIIFSPIIVLVAMWILYFVFWGNRTCVTFIDNLDRMPYSSVIKILSFTHSKTNRKHRFILVIDHGNLYDRYIEEYGNSDEIDIFAQIEKYSDLTFDIGVELSIYRERIIKGMANKILDRASLSQILYFIEKFNYNNLREIKRVLHKIKDNNIMLEYFQMDKYDYFLIGILKRFEPVAMKLIYNNSSFIKNHIQDSTSKVTSYTPESIFDYNYDLEQEFPNFTTKTIDFINAWGEIRNSNKRGHLTSNTKFLYLTNGLSKMYNKFKQLEHANMNVLFKELNRFPWTDIFTFKIMEIINSRLTVPIESLSCLEYSGINKLITQGTIKVDVSENGFSDSDFFDYLDNIRNTLNSLNLKKSIHFSSNYRFKSYIYEYYTDKIKWLESKSDVISNEFVSFVLKDMFEWVLQNKENINYSLLLENERGMKSHSEALIFMLKFVPNITKKIIHSGDMHPSWLNTWEKDDEFECEDYKKIDLYLLCRITNELNIDPFDIIKNYQNCIFQDGLQREFTYEEISADSKILSKYSSK